MFSTIFFLLLPQLYRSLKAVLSLPGSNPKALECVSKMQRKPKAQAGTPWLAFRFFEKLALNTALKLIWTFLGGVKMGTNVYQYTSYPS